MNYDIEKPKNEDKPKNEEIRAELSMWRGLTVLLGIVVVALIVVIFVIPHLFPPAAEVVKYCGDYPCKEEANTLKLDGFDTAFMEFLNCVKPLIAMGFGLSFMGAMAGAILRALGGGK